jgi:hypothetical protein
MVDDNRDFPGLTKRPAPASRKMPSEKRSKNGNRQRKSGYSCELAYENQQIAEPKLPIFWAYGTFLLFLALTYLKVPLSASTRDGATRPETRSIHSLIVSVRVTASLLFRDQSSGKNP